MAVCETCGTKLPKHKAGRPRIYCTTECRALNDAIARLERALGPVTKRLVDGGTHKEKLDLVELRYRLFSLISEEIPRPRNAKGHFMRRAYT